MSPITDFEADAIHIDQLKISAHVGVPDLERANPQQLVICLTLWPTRDFRDLRDDIDQTVNYSTVSNSVKKFAEGRRDKLIETLAENMAAHLLDVFPIRKLRLEIRKFPLPDAEYVSVAVIRERPAV